MIERTGGDEEIQRLIEENRILQLTLEDCKLRLFDALQEDHDVSEASVKNDFTRIWEAIETWVDYVSDEDKVDLRKRYQENLRNRNRNMLKDIGLPSKSLRDLSSLLQWETGRLIISGLIISNFLVTRIFQEPYPLGTTRNQEKVLREIEDLIRAQDQKQGSLSPGLVTFKQPRSDSDPHHICHSDRARVNKWKSQAVSALITSSRFSEHCKTKEKVLFDSLVTTLCSWDPLNASSITRLRQEVFEPAVTLHRTMHCSTRHYTVSHIDVRSGLRSSCTFKDIATWRTLPEDSMPSVFASLYPGLRRVGDYGVEDLGLVKPVLLVHLLVRRKSTLEKKTPISTASLSPVPERQDSGRSSGNEAGRNPLVEASWISDRILPPNETHSKRSSQSSDHSPPRKSQYFLSRRRGSRNTDLQYTQETQPDISLPPRRAQSDSECCHATISIAPRPAESTSYPYAQPPPYRYSSATDQTRVIEYI
jgi:hypothetical protein